MLEWDKYVAFRPSVGHRLFLLVACQTIIAAILVLTASGAISIMSADYRHMYEFQLKSLYEIRKAMEKAQKNESGFPSAPLESFYQEYRSRWEVASGKTFDAIRFRKDLAELGESTLAARETEIVSRLDESIGSKDIHRVREQLANLYDINLKYVDLANVAVMNRMKVRRIRLIVLGSSGILLTLFLGLHVRRAIAPRIQKLVGHVRRFQTVGEHEVIADNGNDDIAVLAHALNVGFASIALRDRERAHFMAIAAHELKTPVTSIQGYAALLVDSSGNTPEVRRALEIIRRQSWRLSRLIETLFLAMRARSRTLQFEPKPLDLSRLLEQVLRELEAYFPRKVFTANIAPDVSILGDEKLLEHAFWVLFTCAAALCNPGAPTSIALFARDHGASITVGLDGSAGSAHEIEQLFVPFQCIQYESAEGIRSAVGLYLCREIARFHSGRLYVRGLSAGSEFVMELPR